uniref:2,3-bisphosphoglycerate-independent phosphoglycerate mutase n=1 Tax=Hommersandiophycus borowitzkae TaxID=268573 RepID=A0A1G4NU25_9FLOR|nr:Phosphoglycerate mutase [Hommersandiophycus borowitzkae]SCW22114.1 Phosphoglycerate mutase [Hommersandiophycus borowitzkae]
MQNNQIHPIVLTILDGWGIGNPNQSNAIHKAQTPTIHQLQKLYPHTSLHASGMNVGLPVGQVGNSEVGHTTIGGGRTILQDLVKITKSIENQSFYENNILNDICLKVKAQKSQIHLIGLCSDGGVHSHIEHLSALLKLIHVHEIKNICIHFIADGRDTEPTCAIKFIKYIQSKIQKLGIGKLCTISGRYYAMDRDCRWSRTQAFYKILTEDQPINIQDPHRVVESFYEQNISDEFIIPTRINEGIIKDYDGIIFFNFRPDRMRQLSQAFCKENFRGFPIKTFRGLEICSFTQYDSTLPIPIAFKAVSKRNFLGEIIAKNNYKQLRIAETEKYAHVTYFFNGGVEEPFDGEDRELISSPQVATYDQAPSMSATQITQSAINAINKGIYSLIVINYANPDMVGHTGNLASTIEAIECIDQQICQLVDAINVNKGTIIITADHGNAEYMLDDNNQKCKSHTTNPVPFIWVNHELRKHQDHNANVQLKSTGSLADIAPTIIDLLNLDKPKEMTGTSLIERITRKYRSTIQL